MADPFTTDNPSSSFHDVPNAIVNVGQVNLAGTETSSKFKGTEDQGVSLYTDYQVRNRYEWDRHVYMIGVTSPNPFQDSTVAFVQLASPTLLWICDWTAARLNKQPEAPDPAPPDGWVLLDAMPETANLFLAPDGQTPLYRLSGTYVYGKKKPSGNVMNEVSYPAPPWMDSSSFSREMPSTLVIKGITAPISVKQLVVTPDNITNVKRLGT